VQVIRTEINKVLHLDTAVGTNVLYLFYGNDSRQKSMAERAALTLRILPPIDDTNGITLDEDVGKFTLNDIRGELVDQEVTERVLERVRVEGSSTQGCNIIGKGGKPCSQAAKKGL